MALLVRADITHCKLVLWGATLWLLNGLCILEGILGLKPTDWSKFVVATVIYHSSLFEIESFSNWNLLLLLLDIELGVYRRHSTFG